MKVDRLIYAVVVALTLIVPSFAYFNTSDGWAKRSLESTLSANRFEQLAKDIEMGKSKPDLAGFPTFLRMQATGQRTLAAMFTSLSDAAFWLLVSAFGVAIVQAALLAWVMARRRRLAREVQP